jgi:hypothetical protein
MTPTSITDEFYDYLSRTDSGRRILEMFAESAARRDGHAPQCQWRCEDGWLIVYTTGRVQDARMTGSSSP